MSMKEAFDTFFEKMNNSWHENLESYPKVVNAKRYENCFQATTDSEDKVDLIKYTLNWRYVIYGKYS